MINVNVYGLDQFVVGDLSKEISPKLAKLYEVEEEEVFFTSTNNMVFHDGLDQTAWRVIIEVNAPKKVEVLQDQVVELLQHYFSTVGIHIEYIFKYFSVDHYVKKINPDYPLFMRDDNIVNLESEYTEEMEEGEEEDQIYTGNIFDDMDIN